MKTLRYQNGGRNGDPEKEAGTDYSKILQGLATMIFGHANPGQYMGRLAKPGALDAIREALGLDETSQAMDEFNEAADQMPSAQGGEMRPNRKDMPDPFSDLGKKEAPGPVERMRAPMQKMRTLSPSTVRNVQKEVAMKDKFYSKPQPSRSNVGEGIEQRKRRFRRR